MMPAPELNSCVGFFSIVLGHVNRIGSLTWHQDRIASGSRDKTILLHDTRTTLQADVRLSAHKQEVCGLKWSHDGGQIASGGNDNRLYVWDTKQSQTLFEFTDHQAAIKAIAWSPHHRGLLASGGGTADRTIRFWNTFAGEQLQTIDTGSQVCNIGWSQHSKCVVSTHGYSQNQVVVWRYPVMQPLANLLGHSMRVLHMAQSPDGESIVTGAGDETLRFWNVFPRRKQCAVVKSKLDLFSQLR